MKYKKNHNEFFYYIIGLYCISIIFSLFFYCLFDCTFTEEEEENDDEEDENEDFEKDDNNNNNNEEKEKLIKKHKKKKTYKICQICGFSIYSEKIIKDREKIKCEFLKLLCKTLKNCFDNIFCIVCNNLYNIFKCNCDNESCEACDNCCDYCSCCYCCDCFDCCFYCHSCCWVSVDEHDKEQKFECCCCCCLDLDNIDYQQNQVYFCYCYQNKRTLKWFNNYISSQIQKKYFLIY